MITLGIESTCHTLGIGIVKNGKMLSNIHDMYKPKNEGIIPGKAADHHAELFAEVLRKNLEHAKIRMLDVDVIAFAQGPGIGAPLAVGTTGAKYLAHLFNKKLIGVNHCYAHLKISEHLTGLNDPLFLYLSGGNTQIIKYEKSFPHVIGETLDVGIGNLFDAFGRAIGLEYAHGSVIEQLAQKGRYVELPYTVKGMNLVFSGLLTQSEKLYKQGVSREDLAYSLMETSFAMTCEATERALFLTKKKKLVLCGGVAQNRRLQKMLAMMCKEDGIAFGVAPDEFNRDNGGMIAFAGEFLYKKYGTKKIGEWKMDTNYRIDKMKTTIGKH
ncbi:MAG: KEOPS complex N(6)-L-threonylcarbamoyladenine synthase Kae1 [Candidatus Micrarchaeota archaeon]